MEKRRDGMELPVNYEACSPYERRLVREEYARIQNGLCSHCGESLNGPPSKEIIRHKVNTKLFPPNFFKWPIHLHHDHDTGMTKGAIHNYCNAVLWQYHGE